MPTAPIFISSAAYDPTDKFRPVSLPMLDIHALGITELDGEPVQQFVPVPPAEPGACFEVVTYQGRVMLVEIACDSPRLLPLPMVRICDSAGAEGEIAVAVLLKGEEG